MISPWLLAAGVFAAVGLIESTQQKSSIDKKAVESKPKKQTKKASKVRPQSKPADVVPSTSTDTSTTTPTDTPTSGDG